MNNYKLFVGSKIFALRQAQGISQEFVAGKLNLSQSWLSSVENESTPIEFNRLCEIADILNVDVNTIINYDKSVTFNSCNQSGYYNTNNINPTDKIEELYKELLREKDERIKILEALKNG